MKGQSNIRNYTISGIMFNGLAFLLLFPILLVYSTPYILSYGYLNFHEGLKSFLSISFLLTLPIGIIIHEALHGFTWAIFAKKGLRSIRYGFNRKAMAPYCHCSEPLPKLHYMLGAAAPCAIMGIIPGVIALMIASNWLIIAAMFFTWAASGDIISLWMLRKVDPHKLIYDHPLRPGFYTSD